MCVCLCVCVCVCVCVCLQTSLCALMPSPPQSVVVRAGVCVGVCVWVCVWLCGCARALCRYAGVRVCGGGDVRACRCVGCGCADVRMSVDKTWWAA